MTCIVGVSDSAGVWMGADSFHGNRSHHKRTGRPKLIRRGSMLIGTCGSVRWNQLLRYRLEVPERGDDVGAEEYMATAFADAVRSCLSEYGWLKKDDERDRGGLALIAYDGRVWKICRDFDVFYASEGYDATGAGEDIALGALHASKGHDSEDRVRTALQAAADHSPWVAPPFDLLFSDGEAEVAA